MNAADLKVVVQGSSESTRVGTSPRKYDSSEADKHEEFEHPTKQNDPT